MSNEIEVPRRGYDTKDVENMARALAVAEGGRNKKMLVLAVLLAAVVVAAWLLARG